MQEKIPIKLKSLREVREIIRSSSNRPRIFMSPTFELLKPMSDNKLKLQNQTPTFSSSSIFKFASLRLSLVSKKFLRSTLS